MTLRLVVASANPAKVTEIAEILGGALEVELLPRPVDVPDVVEDGDTLQANALLKARAICDATGQPAVADDTGLEVDALGGAPGIRSARYAGTDGDSEANIAKLLSELGERAGDPRVASARFRTVAVVQWPDGRTTEAEGVVEGHICVERTGTEGFGYDPVFVPDEGDGRTFAEMAAAEKHAISHRGRAFRQLAQALARH